MADETAEDRRAALVERIADHLRTTPIPAKPEYADSPMMRDGGAGGHGTGHLRYGLCALCRSADIPEALPAVADAVLAFLESGDAGVYLVEGGSIEGVVGVVLAQKRQAVEERDAARALLREIVSLGLTPCVSDPSRRPGGPDGQPQGEAGRTVQWAVRDEDGQTWPCPDQETARKFAARAKGQLLSRYVGGWMTGGDPADVTIPESERIYSQDVNAVLVGWWCERGGGHLDAQGCNSGSVPLYAPSGEAATAVRAWIVARDEEDDRG